jgi:hypothetical protein
LRLRNYQRWYLANLGRKFTEERQEGMKTVRVKIDPLNPAALPVGRVDYQILDSTTESQLADQQKIDDAEEKRKFETGYRNLPEGRE